jgi:hypothetical protein
LKAVIASVAKQSRSSYLSDSSQLQRRSAPRNDSKRDFFETIKSRRSLSGAEAKEHFSPRRRKGRKDGKTALGFKTEVKLSSHSSRPRGGRLLIYLLYA